MKKWTVALFYLLLSLSAYGAETPERAWTVEFGSTAHDYANAMTTDAAGNLYLAGTTQGGAFEPYEFAGGRSDAVVVKLSPTGALRWVAQWGAASKDWVEDIVVTEDGAVYAAGSTEGALDGETQQGLRDAFVTRLDPSTGARIWTRQWGDLGTNSDVVSAREFAANQLTVLSMLDGEDGRNQVELRSLDADGKVVDRKVLLTLQSGLGSRGRVMDMARDHAGNLLLVGWSNYALGPCDGCETARSLGGYVRRTDVFLRKYSPEGALQWSQQYGSTGYDYGMAVAVDSGDNVFVAAIAEGSVDDTTGYLGGQDILLSRFNPQGEPVWRRYLATPQHEWPEGLLIDAADRLFLTGVTRGAFAEQSAQGREDIFLTQWDLTGEQLWLDQYGSEESDRAYDLALVAAAGKLYLTGRSNGYLEGASNQSPGSGDFFVTEYTLPAIDPDTDPANEVPTEDLSGEQPQATAPDTKSSPAAKSSAAEQSPATPAAQATAQRLPFVKTACRPVPDHQTDASQGPVILDHWAALPAENEQAGEAATAIWIIGIDHPELFLETPWISDPSMSLHYTPKPEASGLVTLQYNVVDKSTGDLLPTCHSETFQIQLL